MIGVISDTHDNLEAIAKAVKVFNEKNVSLVLHAGDFVAPFTAKGFKELSCPLKGVFGNNDGDPVALLKFYRGIGEISPGWIKTEHQGKVICLTHCQLPEPPSGCDIYIYGHSHEPEVIKRDCLIVNPGECGGWLSNKHTIALVDPERIEAQIIEL
jgi:putative phosphoesterase